MQRPSTAGRRMQVSTLDQDTIGNIHTVIFGNQNMEFPPAWQGGFAYREDGMLCGLRQREGGPCGVIAAVQAFVLREVYAASEAEGVERIDPNTVPREVAGDALVRALAHIIWAARVGRVASVVNCKTARLPQLRSAAGELTATQCGSQADVTSCVRASIGSYRSPDGPGIALLLYSVTLTRGIAMVGRDADFPSSLIMGNGYCAQELVNLLIVGRAHSNVFNGEQRVGSSAESGAAGGDADDGCRLRGIPRRAPVGFLTLFEKQQYGERDRELITVGSNYKRPMYHIFVVQSESHYSVLWGAMPSILPPEVLEEGESRLPGDPDPSDEGYEEEDEEDRPKPLGSGECFDLYYFDQMAERNDAVRLTISRAGAGGLDYGNAPPLELVILSRWPGAAVDWNGEEVIL